MLSKLPSDVKNIMSVCSFPSLLIEAGLTTSAQPTTEQETSNLSKRSLINWSNVIAYIGGYILHKLKHKMCESYSNNLMASEISPSTWR